MWAVCTKDQAQTLHSFSHAICILGRIGNLHLHCPQGGSGSLPFPPEPPPREGTTSGVTDHSIQLHLDVQVIRNTPLPQLLKLCKSIPGKNLLLQYHSCFLPIYSLYCFFIFFYFRVAVIITTRCSCSLSVEKNFSLNLSNSCLGQEYQTTQRRFLITFGRRREIRWTFTVTLWS